MRAIEEKANIFNESTTVGPSTLRFRVVVNNYRQKENEYSEETDEDFVDTTTNSGQHGLPPQPARYIKYPEYDWF